MCIQVTEKATGRTKRVSLSTARRLTGTPTTEPVVETYAARFHDCHTCDRNRACYCGPTHEVALVAGEA